MSTGRLEGAALAEAYASADLLAFPSRTDTFGNVLLEGKASGGPVVAADVASTREVLAGAGALFAGGDADALADRVRQLAAAPAARRRMAAAGLAVARTRSWDAVFDALFSDCLAVIRERGAARTGYARAAAAAVYARQASHVKLRQSSRRAVSRHAP